MQETLKALCRGVALSWEGGRSSHYDGKLETYLSQTGIYGFFAFILILDRVLLQVYGFYFRVLHPSLFVTWLVKTSLRNLQDQYI